jgi:hypothetical protein
VAYLNLPAWHYSGGTEESVEKSCQDSLWPRLDSNRAPLEWQKHLYVSQRTRSNLLGEVAIYGNVVVLHICCGMLGICEDSCSNLRFVPFPPSWADVRKDQWRACENACMFLISSLFQLQIVLKLLITIVVFWDVTPCSLIDRYNGSEEPCCHHIQVRGARPMEGVKPSSLLSSGHQYAFLGVKQVECEARHSFPYRSDVTNAWCFTSTPSGHLRIVIPALDELWWNVKIGYSKGEGSKFLWNTGTYLPDYMASHPRRP